MKAILSEVFKSNKMKYAFSQDHDLKPTSTFGRVPQYSSEQMFTPMS